MNFLQAIEERVILLDGAMGTMVQNLDVTDLDFGGEAFRMLPDILTFSRPADIEDIHLSYFRAGANAVETNTFGASPFRLAEYDFTELNLSLFAPIPGVPDLRALTYEEFAYALSKRAAEIACAARELHKKDDDYQDRPLFVIGSIGPSNRVLSSTEADLKESTFDEMAENFYHQVLGLIDGGADVLSYETQQDILEVKAAVIGGKKALAERGAALPIMVHVAVDEFSRMQIFNTSIHAALVAVQGIGIDVFGINCSIGPELMVKTIEKIARYSQLPISVMPNAGLPTSENGQTVYKLGPDSLADSLERFITEFGVNIVGGCCGTGPDHIRAIARRLDGIKPARRQPDTTPFVSGPQEVASLDGGEALVLIGERLNLRGSKKVRDAVEGQDEIQHHVLEDVVDEQINGLGLTILDLCMDSNQVDTTKTLKDVVRKITTDFAGALSIDSFDVDALCQTIKVYPGRPIINSISMEEVSPGVTKLDAVVEATKQHDPVYIALATGPDGPAATRDEKYALAKSIVQAAAKHGIAPDRLLIDMNVFPLGAEADPNMNFALESLEAIPLIKSIHPDLRTTCGIGNLTNGLAKKPYMRKVLTSVWLDEARKRGLDAAIINPHHYVFVQDLEQGHYELGLKAILERDMDAYEALEVIAEEKKGHTVVKRATYDDLPLEEAICRKIIDGFKEREAGTLELNGHTYHYADKITLQAAQTLAKHTPLDLINDYLMVAMQELGDRFAHGEVSLPHLLKSADVMKQVMIFLEEYMHVQSGVDINTEIQYKGTVVLGTVYQDVHSIGKDLAKTLFENYGYRAIDLGVMTPLQAYIDAAKEHNADAIGASALLVQTSNHMITLSRMMLDQGLGDTCLLVGGAPVSPRHAAHVAMAGGDNPDDIRKNVFYCATAMDGVNIMNELARPGEAKELLKKNQAKLRARLQRDQGKTQRDQDLLKKLPSRVITFDNHTLPDSPWFKPEVLRIPLIQFREHIQKKTLYSLNWRFGSAAARIRQGTTDQELERLFLEWTEKADTQGWLEPQGMIALYPCHSQGNEVIVYDIDDPKEELGRFDFDRVIGAGKEDTICSAQYFRPRGNGKLDAIALQISTTGTRIEDQLQKFKAQGDSESTLYLQGLADRLAEDMAAYLHETLRARVGLAGTSQGTRWSPGYPAITNTQNNKRILDLLGAQKEIGITITPAGQFNPTGTTAALISFHPDARYS